MAAETPSLFVMNANRHYFQINMQEVAVNKEQMRECRFFDTEKTLLEVVCRDSGCDLEEVEGTTFYITMRDGALVAIDDRGFAHAIDCPVEDYISDFIL